MLAENVDRYLEYMEEAKRLGSDIIVFPEYGVSGSAVSEAEDREAAREFMVVGEVGRKRVEHGSDVKFDNAMDSQ